MGGVQSPMVISVECLNVKTLHMRWHFGGVEFVGSPVVQGPEPLTLDLQQSCTRARTTHRSSQTKENCVGGKRIAA